MTDLELCSAGDQLVPSGETVFIDFDGGQVAVVLVNGEPQPIPRIASDALNLSWPAQYRKLQEDPAICVAETTTQLLGDDQARTVITTDLEGFGLWLAKINANKVAPEARDLVITWQRKAGRAIRERFFGKPVSRPLGEVDLLDELEAANTRASRALVGWRAERQRSQALLTTVKELAVPAKAWDTLIATGRSWDVGYVAKRLTEKGAKRCGRNLLYARLRELDWVFQNTQEPKQGAVDRGYVKAEDQGTRTDRETGDEVENKPRTRIKPKGVLRLAELYGVPLTLEEIDHWSVDSTMTTTGGAA